MDEPNAIPSTHVHTLPWFPHINKYHPSSDEACIICNENLQENESKAGITKLPCKHIFDRDCIVPWLELVSRCIVTLLPMALDVMRLFLIFEWIILSSLCVFPCSAQQLSIMSS